MIQVGLIGSSGRMGQWVSKLLETEFSKKGHLSERVSQGGNLDPLLQMDVVIDFSTPQAMSALAQLALRAPNPPCFVVGSTGWKIDEKKWIDELAKKTPVLMASNFSTGVHALLHVLRDSAPMLEKLGYSPVILETHHRHKKDAPSGTALSLQRAIAPAGPGNIPTHSVRAGEIIGDHEVIYYGSGDHLTFGHFAQDRSIFARGAIECALWLAQQKRSQTLTSGLWGIETYFKELIQ